ncbi:MAG: ABC transporter permease [Candidatus Micrarchaeota archaeon]
MGASLELLKWELRQIFLDGGFLGKIAIGMLISLLLLPFLLNSISSFTESVNAPNLPFVYKIVNVAIVGENSEIEKFLAGDTLLNVAKLSGEEAKRRLAAGDVVGVAYLSKDGLNFVGNNKPESNLAELHVRDAVDKVIRRDRNLAVKSIQKESVEPFVKGIIAPFVIFSPLLLWCLPIIQSISYDRENKMLEALFSLPIKRRKIFLAKVFANFLFAAFACAIWLAVLAIFGLTVSDYMGVWAILSLISLLIISMNGLVSTISSNVKNATLAAGIASTLVFSFLFILSLLRINPYLAEYSMISPVTYISYQVSGLASPFPWSIVIILVLIAAAAIILSISAFCTEKFAFSLNPGIMQLYEGMREIWPRTEYSTFAMGLVAFSLTFPVQAIALGFMLFISSSFWIALLILAGVEELLKLLPLRMIGPKNLKEGAYLGAIIGIGYGIGESVLFAPFIPLDILRIVPIIAHAIFSAIAGMGVSRKHPWAGLVAATILHFIYNFWVIGRII